MPFRVTCPACQTPCVVPDEAVGRKVRCKRCSNVFQLAAAKPKPPVLDEASRLEEVAEPAPDGLQTAPKSRPSAKKQALARPSVRFVKRARRPVARGLLDRRSGGRSFSCSEAALPWPWFSPTRTKTRRKQHLPPTWRQATRTRAIPAR